MSIYTVIIGVIVPSLISLILNLCIFKHVHSLSRRIQIQRDTHLNSVTMDQYQKRISRRDIYLLRHTIFMFTMFITGWTPIFALVAIDYAGNVIPLVYAILQILAVIASFCSILDLFLYNHELRRYIKQKLLSCF